MENDSAVYWQNMRVDLQLIGTCLKIADMAIPMDFEIVSYF